MFVIEPAILVVVFFGVCMSNDVKLQNFSELNEAMRDVVNASLRVNTLALNAMFMVKHDGSGKSGFSKITTFLRDFSAKLNQQMTSIILISNKMLMIAAKYKVSSHYEKLIEKGMSDKRATYLRGKIDAGRNSRKYLELLVDEMGCFHKDIKLSLRLIGSAEAMIVLTKIEVESSGINAKTAGNLTRDLEDAVSRIDMGIKVCANALAA